MNIVAVSSLAICLGAIGLALYLNYKDRQEGKKWKYNMKR